MSIQSHMLKHWALAKGPLLLVSVLPVLALGSAVGKFRKLERGVIPKCHPSIRETSNLVTCVDIAIMCHSPSNFAGRFQPEFRNQLHAHDALRRYQTGCP
jgi:hypothetical protein